MKPTATFKMTKKTKTILACAGFKDQATRAAFKNMMIQAELAASIVPRSTKETDSKQG